jgi:hypothetical protein
MVSVSKVVIATALGASALAFSAANASAAIACTGNVCWHSHEKYEYPPSANITVHEDTWKAGPSVTFREHEGRGYWKGNTWSEW